MKACWRRERASEAHTNKVAIKARPFAILYADLKAQ